MEFRSDRTKKQKIVDTKRRKFPPKPEKDLLIIYRSNTVVNLEEWQRDILTMMREEMLYFWPQLETKIMNEGWASYLASTNYARNGFND